MPSKGRLLTGSSGSASDSRLLSSCISMGGPRGGAATEWAASVPSCSCGHSLFLSHAETPLVIGLIVGEHELGVAWVIRGVFTSKYRLLFDGVSERGINN